MYTPYEVQVGLGADVSVSGTIEFVGGIPNNRVVDILAGTSNNNKVIPANRYFTSRRVLGEVGLMGRYIHQPV